jgi:GTP-binding protein
MANKDAVYIKSIRGSDEILTDGKPQIAFMGRSNVGKSSLINALTGKKGLARSSSSPGKTVSLDFFLINGTTYFVDLPGYGYARATEEQREKFRKMIAWYLFRSGIKQKLAVIVIDANVGITDYDRESMGLLREAGTPFVIAANKTDKLKTAQRGKILAGISRDAGDAPVVPFSAMTGLGRSELLTLIFA